MDNHCTTAGFQAELWCAALIYKAPGQVTLSSCMAEVASSSVRISTNPNLPAAGHALCWAPGLFMVPREETGKVQQLACGIKLSIDHGWIGLRVGHQVRQGSVEQLSQHHIGHHPQRQVACRWVHSAGCMLPNTGMVYWSSHRALLTNIDLPLFPTRHQTHAASHSLHEPDLACADLAACPLAVSFQRFTCCCSISCCCSI